MSGAAVRLAGNAFAPDVPAPVAQFLGCATPQEWLAAVPAKLDVLLLDHANCEKKAAASAVNLLFRYPGEAALGASMSRLAREELRHYEQVTRIAAQRGIAHRPVRASGYAAALRAIVRTQEPGRLVDTLICGALIEARSCERFAALLPHLDEPLARFYSGLLASEARHFGDYLELARRAAGAEIDDRVADFVALEAQQIVRPDTTFAFHSGPPADCAATP